MSRLSLKAFTIRLKRILQIELAADWDNVGLLVGDQSDGVSNVFMTNDLTRLALLDAKANSSGNSSAVIIAYHPLLFRPISSITTESSWQKDVMIKCIQSGFSVFSPHTALDCMHGGVNDWLASMFGLVKDFTINSLERSSIKDSEKRCVTMNSNPNQLSRFKENSLSEDIGVLRFNYHNQELWYFTISDKFWNGLKDDMPKDSIVDDRPMKDVVGTGRILKLKKALTLNQIVDIVKDFLGVKHVRICSSLSNASDFDTIATCPGAGGSLLKWLPNGCVYLTGEMGHHQLLEAKHKNVTVILTEHSNCERGYLSQVLLGALTEQFPGVAFRALSDGGDPVDTVL